MAKAPLNPEVTCSCGTKVTGGVSTCWTCGKPVDLFVEERAERSEKRERAAERERRARSSLLRRLWFAWKFRGLERALLGRRAGVYRMDHAGSGRFIAGNTQMRSSGLITGVPMTGEDAWSLILETPAALCLSLTCRSCGHIHLLVTGNASRDPLAAFGDRIGRFGDHYQGTWQSEWFTIVRPIFRGGIEQWMQCRKCDARADPALRHY